MYLILGCIFVAELRVALGKPLHCCSCAWHTAPRLLIDVSKFYEKHGFSPAPLRPSASFSSNAVCFKIRNQLSGQIIVICQPNKAISNVANWEKC